MRFLVSELPEALGKIRKLSLYKNSELWKIPVFIFICDSPEELEQEWSNTASLIGIPYQSELSGLGSSFEKWNILIKDFTNFNSKYQEIGKTTNLVKNSLSELYHNSKDELKRIRQVNLSSVEATDESFLKGDDENGEAFKEDLTILRDEIKTIENNLGLLKKEIPDLEFRIKNIEEYDEAIANLVSNGLELIEKTEQDKDHCPLCGHRHQFMED